MNMPVIQTAFVGWMNPITLIKVSQTVNNDGNVIDTESPINFVGTIQPLMPTKLIVSPSGQRFWAWLMIHTPYELGAVIDDNDLLKYKNKKYKVMLTNDYQLNGYFEYHLVEEYQA